MMNQQQQQQQQQQFTNNRYNQQEQNAPDDDQHSSAAIDNQSLRNNNANNVSNINNASQQQFQEPKPPVTPDRPRISQKLLHRDGAATSSHQKQQNLNDTTPKQSHNISMMNPAGEQQLFQQAAVANGSDWGLSALKKGSGSKAYLASMTRNGFIEPGSNSGIQQDGGWPSAVKTHLGSHIQNYRMLMQNGAYTGFDSPMLPCKLQNRGNHQQEHQNNSVSLYEGVVSCSDGTQNKKQTITVAELQDNEAGFEDHPNNHTTKRKEGYSMKSPASSSAAHHRMLNHQSQAQVSAEQHISSNHNGSRQIADCSSSPGGVQSNSRAADTYGRSLGATITVVTEAEHHQEQLSSSTNNRHRYSHSKQRSAQSMSRMRRAGQQSQVARDVDHDDQDGEDVREHKERMDQDDASEEQEDIDIVADNNDDIEGPEAGGTTSQFYQTNNSGYPHQQHPPHMTPTHYSGLAPPHSHTNMSPYNYYPSSQFVAGGGPRSPYFGGGYYGAGSTVGPPPSSYHYDMYGGGPLQTAAIRGFNPPPPAPGMHHPHHIAASSPHRGHYSQQRQFHHPGYGPPPIGYEPGPTYPPQYFYHHQQYYNGSTDLNARLNSGYAPGPSGPFLNPEEQLNPAAAAAMYYQAGAGGLHQHPPPPYHHRYDGSPQHFHHQPQYHPIIGGALQQSPSHRNGLAPALSYHSHQAPHQLSVRKSSGSLRKHHQASSSAAKKSSQALEDSGTKHYHHHYQAATMVGGPPIMDVVKSTNTPQRHSSKASGGHRHQRGRAPSTSDQGGPAGLVCRKINFEVENDEVSEQNFQDRDEADEGEVDYDDEAHLDCGESENVKATTQKVKMRSSKQSAAHHPASSANLQTKYQQQPLIHYENLDHSGEDGESPAQPQNRHQELIYRQKSHHQMSSQVVNESQDQPVQVKTLKEQHAQKSLSRSSHQNHYIINSAIPGVGTRMDKAPQDHYPSVNEMGNILMGDCDQDDVEDIQTTKEDKFVKIIMPPSATNSNHQKQTSCQVQMDIDMDKEDVQVKMGVASRKHQGATTKGEAEGLTMTSLIRQPSKDGACFTPATKTIINSTKNQSTSLSQFERKHEVNPSPQLISIRSSSQTRIATASSIIKQGAIDNTPDQKPRSSQSNFQSGGPGGPSTLQRNKSSQLQQQSIAPAADKNNKVGVSQPPVSKLGGHYVPSGSGVSQQGDNNKANNQAQQNKHLRDIELSSQFTGGEVGGATSSNMQSASGNVHKNKRRSYAFNESSGQMERIIRKRKRKTTGQLEELTNAFDSEPHWSKETLAEISIKTGLTEAQVYKWGWDQKRKKFGVVEAERMRQYENLLDQQNAKKSQNRLASLQAQIQANQQKQEVMTPMTPSQAACGDMNASSQKRQPELTPENRSNGAPTPCQETTNQTAIGVSGGIQQHFHASAEPIITAYGKNNLPFQKVTPFVTEDTHPYQTMTDQKPSTNPITNTTSAITTTGQTKATSFIQNSQAATSTNNVVTPSKDKTKTKKQKLHKVVESGAEATKGKEQQCLEEQNDDDALSEKFTPETVKKTDCEHPPHQSNKKRTKKFQIKDCGKLQKLTDHIAANAASNSCNNSLLDSSNDEQQIVRQNKKIKKQRKTTNDSSNIQISSKVEDSTVAAAAETNKNLKGTSSSQQQMHKTNKGSTTSVSAAVASSANSRALRRSQAAMVTATTVSTTAANLTPQEEQ